PDQGWSQRETLRPPTSDAIQPNTGDQMGKPVKRQRKNASATSQCVTRTISRWRTMTSPTMTSWFRWAKVTPSSTVEGATPRPGYGGESSLMMSASANEGHSADGPVSSSFGFFGP